MLNVRKPHRDLPDWFPLEIYKKKLSAHEWLYEITERLSIAEQREGLSPRELKDKFIRRIVDCNRAKEVKLEYDHVPPVETLSAARVLGLASELRRSPITHQYQRALEQISSDNESEPDWFTWLASGEAQQVRDTPYVHYLDDECTTNSVGNTTFSCHITTAVNVDL